MTDKNFAGDPFGPDTNLPRRQPNPGETAEIVVASDNAFTIDQHGGEAGHVDDRTTQLGRQVLEAQIHGKAFGKHAFTGVPNSANDPRTPEGRDAFLNDFEHRVRPK